MTKVFISFDTEDYVNPHGVDGIIKTAAIHEKHGVVGCYNVVARLAQALVRWGRQDAIEALKGHEIEHHSLAHSLHPTINEYTDIEDFEEAKRAFLKNEIEGREIIRAVFGVQDLYAACPPGDSVSYVAHYGYADMGIGIYDGDWYCDIKRNRPVYACNIACLRYSHCLDDYLAISDRDRIDADLDKIAEEKDFYIFYHHPQMGIIDQFCDEVNRMTPENEGQWKLSGYRPKEERDKFYENFDYLIGRLKDDPRFEIMTYKQLAKELESGSRVIRREDIPEIMHALDAYFFPVTTPDSYCITDILYACRDLLLGKACHRCGYVYGFLYTPYAIGEAVTVGASEIYESAKQIKDDFLPTSIRVGGKELGPRDWLNGALCALCGQDVITLKPSDWQIDLAQFPTVQDMDLRGTWIHDDSFEDAYLSERFRLQSWTYRLPKNTPRKIFYD